MRRGVGVIVALGLGLGLAPSASAADYWPLRGSTYDPPPVRNWEGFYVGGQVGAGSGGANFSGNSNALLNELTDQTFWQTEGIPNWTTADRGDTGFAMQYGAFLGYNFQWGDVVIGLEASYYHTDASASAGGRTPMNNGFILIPDGGSLIWPTAVSGGSYITLSDFGTLRMRTGWAVGSFLPYVAGGVAIGRASYGDWATLTWGQPYDDTTGVPDPNNGPGSSTTSENKSNALIYGWSLGGGVDVALMSNVFLRAEYEYVQFSQSRLNLNNIRGGLGIKF